MEIINQVKNELKGKNDSTKAINFADMILQYCELQDLTDTDGSTLRDRFMAENVQWILQQEQQRGYERIFVTGHNSHVAKWGSFDSMGKLLSNETDDGYYVIGTDFYRKMCIRDSSLSMKGCPYDNAVAEATYKVIKTEFVNHQIFETQEQLGYEFADYVNWYNNHRIHSSLGYLSPVEYRQNTLKKVV